LHISFSVKSTKLTCVCPKYDAQNIIYKIVLVLEILQFISNLLHLLLKIPHETTVKF